MKRMLYRLPGFDFCIVKYREPTEADNNIEWYTKGRKFNHPGNIAIIEGPGMEKRVFRFKKDYVIKEIENETLEELREKSPELFL